MAKPKRHSIYIYDHPESKIRFLEQTLMGKDWRATVVFDPHSDSSVTNIEMLSSTLLKRGYTVAKSFDDKGRITLEIHHLGKGSKIGDVVRESGLWPGLKHLLSHPASPLSAPIRYAGKGYDWVVGALHDPARANGIINTTAEGFLIAAGAGAQYGKFTDPKNALQSLSGLSWASQSLLYLFFAKNNETRAFNIIKNKVDKTLQTGGDITTISFDPHHDAEKDNLADKASRFLHRFPVTLGAILNNMGMGFYIWHAFLERRYRSGQLKLNPHDADAARYVGNGNKGLVNWSKTGFGKDIIGAVLSLIGWTVLMIPPTKHVPESDQLADRSPLRKLWDSFRENTPKIAGLFTLGASSFRLMGARDKKNKWQQTGETVYIGGDVALMFTDSHEYGGDAKMNQDKLSDMIVNYLGQLPYVYGRKEQEQATDRIMQFWMDKFHVDAPKLGKKPQSYKAWVQRSAAETRQQVMRKFYHQQTERLEHIGESAAEIVAHFPVAMQTELIDRLSQTLYGMPWMRASQDEIRNNIVSSLERLPKKDHNSVNSTHVAGDVAALSHIVPNANLADTISVLYDTLAPYMIPKSIPKSPTEQTVSIASGTTASRPSSNVRSASRIDTIISPSSAALAHA